MSDHIPFELQEKIIEILPVKSLLQFRSVSKAWKSLIDSSDFIASHSIRHSHSQRLIIRYDEWREIETWKKCVTFVDDHNFPQHRSDLILPWSFLTSESRIIGGSHGLLCLYGDLGVSSHKFRAEICNPFIRKLISIDLPDASPETILGFGVSPVSSDPMIVKIIRPWKVDVYTLSSGNWRSLSKNLPRDSIRFKWSQVVIDRFIYWSAYEMIAIDDTERTYAPCQLIISFDMTTESFQEIDLSDHIASGLTVSICKLRESLVVLTYSRGTMRRFWDVWIMDHGDQSSFTRLYNIRSPDEKMNILGFRKTGELIMETEDDHYKPVAEPSPLIVYEPNSKHSEGLGIYGRKGSFTMNSYVETLLLLGRSDCYSY